MTADQFDALPDSEGRRWELLDGELIDALPATPEHNLILGRLFFLLYSFVRPRKFGQLLLRIDLAFVSIRGSARTWPSSLRRSGATSRLTARQWNSRPILP